MISLCIVLVILLIVCCCQSQPCHVSFNSTLFTIRGPCPNDTVLLVPVGDTVRYRCDYEDRSGDSYDIYWHIAGLDGSPFFYSNEGKYIISSIYIAGIRITLLRILVKEEYLNITLDIQCGLCSLSVCNNEGQDRLNENIISTSVKLVSVGKLTQYSTD